MAQLSAQLLDDTVIVADQLVRVRKSLDRSIVSLHFETSIVSPGCLSLWSISNAHFGGIASEIRCQTRSVIRIEIQSNEKATPVERCQKEFFLGYQTYRQQINR